MTGRVVVVTKARRCPKCGRTVVTGSSAILVVLPPPPRRDKPTRPRAILYHPKCAT